MNIMEEDILEIADAHAGLIPRHGRGWQEYKKLARVSDWLKN